MSEPDYSGIAKADDSAAPATPDYSGITPDLASNYNAASKQNPDEAAKIISTSTKTGMSPAYVAKNLKEAQAAANAPSKEFFDNLSGSFPVTAKLLGNVMSMAKLHDDIPNVVGHEDAIQKFHYADNWLQAIQSGYQESATGSLIRGVPPDIALGKEASFAYRRLANVGQYGADMLLMAPASLAVESMVPAAVAGGGIAALLGIPVAEGAVGEALTTAIGGAAVKGSESAAAFAFPAAIKLALQEKFKNGDYQGARDIIERTFSKVLPGTAKSALTGVATAASGGAARFFGANALSQIAAETTGMTVAGAGLEGHAPSADEFAGNIILAGGLHAIGAAREYDAQITAAKAAIQKAQAEESRNFVYTMDAHAQESLWRKRDPEGYAAHIAELGAGKPPRIPLADFEKQFPAPDQMAAKLGISKQYQEAKLTKGDVVIPLDKFLSADLDKDRLSLASSVRFDPDAKTLTGIDAEGEEKAAEEKSKAESEKKAQDQGAVRGFVSQIRKMIWMDELPEETVKTAKEALAPKPPAISDKPGIEGEASREIGFAREDLGHFIHDIPADPELNEHYKNLEAAARDRAEAELLKPRIAALRAENRAKLDAIRADLTDKATTTVDNLPIFLANSDIVNSFKNPEGNVVDWANTEPVKFGDENAKLASNFVNGKMTMYKAYIYNEMAKVHGFSSGDELARKTLEAHESNLRENSINEIVEKGMAPHEGLRDPAALRADAHRAVHNEDMGQLLALKAKMLESAKASERVDAVYREDVKKQARVEWNRAKEIAKTFIANKNVEDAGKFRTYFTQERDAALRTYKAAKKGDFEGAAEETRAQLLNHAMASEALRALDRIERDTRAITKFQKADKDSFNKSTDHFQQVGELLWRFGFPRDDYEHGQKTESLADFVDRRGENLMVPDWIKNEGMAEDYKKLTVSQLKDLRNTLATIKHDAVASSEKTKLFDGEKLDALVNELHASKEASSEGGKARRGSKVLSPVEQLISAKDDTRNWIITPQSLLYRHLDGSKQGAWTKALVSTENAAESARSDMHSWFAEQYDKMHSAYSKRELEDMASKPIWVPEMNDSMTKNEIITLASYQGTADGQEKANTSHGLSHEKVKAILDREMTARDWDLVQAKLDLISTHLKPKIKALQMEMAGFEPDWIEAKPIQTKFGEKPGGYYHLSRDFGSPKGFFDMRGDEALGDTPQAWKAMTAQGYLKDRNEMARYDVSLDSDDYIRHVSDVIHDLTMRKWVVDSSRILAHPSVQADLIDALGPAGKDKVDQWVRDIAGQDRQQVRGYIEKVSRYVRGRTSTALIASKLSVVLSQFHGVTAAGAVEPDQFSARDAVGAVLTGMAKGKMDKGYLEDLIKRVDAESPFMRQLGRNSDRDLGEANRRMFNEKDPVRDFSTAMFSAIHHRTTYAIWDAARARGMELFDGDVKQANEFADHIVRDSSVGGSKSQLPEAMKGSELSMLLTQLHGFLNVQAQLLYRGEGRLEANFSKDKLGSMAQALGTYAALMVIPAAMYNATHLYDTKKKWAKGMMRGMSPLTLVPVVSTMQDWVIDSALGLKGNDSLIPATSALTNLHEAWTAMRDRTNRHSTQDKIEAASKVAEFTGLPIPGYFMKPIPDQFFSWFWNAANIAECATPRVSDLALRRPRSQRGR